MVRIGGIALILMALPAAASGKPAPGPSSPGKLAQPTEEVRAFRSMAITPTPSDFDFTDRIGLKTELSPTASFGIGIFGLKAERNRQAPVTVREIAAPKTRRAGVGISLKF